MEYIDANNTKQRPIMVHRAIFGSLERFFGILIENYAGAFPLWLAPVQVRAAAGVPSSVHIRQPHDTCRVGRGQAATRDAVAVWVRFG
jgi:hypothetical protein